VGFSAGFGASNIDLLAVTDKFVLAVCFDISGICLEFGADTFRLASSFIIFLILDCCFGIGDGIIFGEEDNVGEDDIVCGDDNDELDDDVCDDDIIGRGGLIDDLFEDKVMGEVAVVAESLLDIVADADSSCGCVLSDWVLFSSVVLVRNDVLNGWMGISSGDDRGRLDVSALVTGLRSKVVVVVLDDNDDVIVVMGIVEVVVVVVVVVVTVVVVVIDVVVIIGGGAVGAVVIITVVVVVSTL